MWTLKNCPRCQGDLYAEREDGGWYDSCLQCGYNQAHRTTSAISRSDRIRPVVQYATSLGTVSFALRG